MRALGSFAANSGLWAAAVLMWATNASRRAHPPAGTRARLGTAKEAAGLDGTEARLSWHSLRHGFASMLATDLELPATTLARIVGHADAGFSLRVYAKDAQDETAVVSEVLNRASRIGG